ncbi:MAG: hypothetical protein ABFD24_06080 [Anaerolineaceae bacterium]
MERQFTAKIDFEQMAAELVKNINANREKIVEAFIAEIGLPPSEVLLIEQHNPGLTTLTFVRRKTDDQEINRLKQENETLYMKWIRVDARLTKFEERYELPGIDLIPKSMRDEYSEEQIEIYNAKPSRGNHSTNRERLVGARKAMRQDIVFKLSFMHRSKPGWTIDHEQEIKEILDQIDADVEIRIAGNDQTLGVDYE